MRERTVVWADPARTAAEGARLAGLDFIRAIASGELPRPPIGELLDMDIVEADPGRVVFRCEVAEWMYNPIGSVHGGIAATLLDSCMGCAVHTLLDAGVGYTTVDLQVRYVRPMSAQTGPVEATGTVVHCGRRLATAEGRLVGPGERLLAHATTSCLILE
jgi:uncharacterized protein (TIGR00369 family)